MEDKYYTPTVEEIIDHIIYGEKIYTIINDEYIHINIQPNPTGLINFIESNNLYMDKYGNKIHGITPELYKIKYLDREDIESFGFKFKSKLIDDWYRLDTSIRIYSGYYFTGFKLIHDRENSFKDESDHKYNIKILAEYNGGEDVLFEGIIKNKSEFKKLLIQLGI